MEFQNHLLKHVTSPQIGSTCFATNYFPALRIPLSWSRLQFPSAEYRELYPSSFLALCFLMFSHSKVYHHLERNLDIRELVACFTAVEQVIFRDSACPPENTYFSCVCICVCVYYSSSSSCGSGCSAGFLYGCYCDSDSRWHHSRHLQSIKTFPLNLLAFLLLVAFPS